MCCLCEALVEDDAEELHRLLDLDRDVIDLQDDICRDVLASSEVNGDRLVERDLEAPFFEKMWPSPLGIVVRLWTMLKRSVPTSTSNCRQRTVRA